MDYLWTILLGALQGATEFLPVSSSGHLATGQILLKKFGFAGSLFDQPLLFEIMLHLATLLAVVLFYRRDILQIFLGMIRIFPAFFKRQFFLHLHGDDKSNTFAALVVGTIPTGIIGYLMADITETISRSTTTLSFLFMACACVLFAGKWWVGGSKRMTLKAAFLIGIIQGIAVLPGISRSGVTIVCALALGIEREEAARFSFLLSIPAILGAAVLKLDINSLISGGHTSAFIFGTAAAFIVGLVALLFLVRLVKAGRMWLFAPYVASVGLALLLFI